MAKTLTAKQKEETKENRKKKMNEIQQKLIDGTKAVFSSEDYKKYLTTMSKFHGYSVNNLILIMLQKPDATVVAGYNKWKQMNRNVKKGEHGIMIMAPCTVKKKMEEDVADEMEAEKVKKVTFFKPAYVFDYSQTEGEPLPEVVHALNADVKDFEKIKNALLKVAPVPVSFTKINNGANGYFSFSDQKICIKKDMSELQTVKTMIHEIAHAKLGHGSPETKNLDRNTKEVQAESVAFWVSQMLGLDTSDYSFGYISTWSKDREVSELHEQLEIIKSTADGITKELEVVLG